MANIKHTLPSGVEITDDDLKMIQKSTSRDNLKTGLAIIGAGAIVFFVRGFMLHGQVVYEHTED